MPTLFSFSTLRTLISATFVLLLMSVSAKAGELHLLDQKRHEKPYEDKLYYEQSQDERIDQDKRKTRRGSATRDLPYRRFRVDVNLLSINLYNNKSLGFGLSAEPKVFITKNWSVGVLAGANARFNSFRGQQLSITDPNGGRINARAGKRSPASTLITYQLTTDYHILARRALRPYIGLGAGIVRVREFSIPILSDITEPYNPREGANFLTTQLWTEARPITYFLLTPRIGIDVWHLRINFQYNLAFSGSGRSVTLPGFTNAVQSQGEAGTRESNFSVARRTLNGGTIQIIFYFGGGRKK